MESLDRFAREKHAALAARSLAREIVSTARRQPPYITQQKHDFISFSCNDYLGLAGHPDVIDAAREATSTFGAGAGASRLITGSHPLYEKLEERLAAFKKTEAACIFGSGYLANTGVIPCFAGPPDLVLIDELSHACLHAGAQLSRATVAPFPHNDIDRLQELLQKRAQYRHALVITEGVFSMDGDRAPLVALAALAENHDAWLLVDDAHALGVIGADGRGSAHTQSPPAAVPLQMGTLSKALGSYGGYLCASRAVVEFVKTRARTLIYSTGLPPAVIAAALAGLERLIQTPELAARPMARARQFCAALGLAPPQSPIVPIILGDADTALQASAALAERGFLVTAIRPPTVPQDTARLRLTFSAAHDESDIARLIDAFRALELTGKNAVSAA